MEAAEKLVKALQEVEAPKNMVDLAKNGYYGDFSSPLACPITQLVNDAVFYGFNSLAKRAANGEFDGE